MEEASGPVQLHRSAIVTVLDELAALAGAAGMMATLAAFATASVAVAKAAISHPYEHVHPLWPPARQRAIDSPSPQSVPAR